MINGTMSSFSQSSSLTTVELPWPPKCSRSPSPAHLFEISLLSVETASQPASSASVSSLFSISRVLSPGTSAWGSVFILASKARTSLACISSSNLFNFRGSHSLIPSYLPTLILLSLSKVYSVLFWEAWLVVTDFSPFRRRFEKLSKKMILVHPISLVGGHFLLVKSHRCCGETSINTNNQHDVLGAVRELDADVLGAVRIRCKVLQCSSHSLTSGFCGSSIFFWLRRHSALHFSNPLLPPFSPKLQTELCGATLPWD